MSFGGGATSGGGFIPTPVLRPTASSGGFFSSIGSSIGSIFSGSPEPTIVRGIGNIPTPVLKPASGISSLFKGIGEIATAITPALQVASLIGGTAVQSSGRLEQASIERDAAEFNAQVAERDASLSIFSAEQEASEVKRDSVRRLKAIRSSFAKGGVVSTSGSALLAQLEAIEQGDLEVQKTLFEGRLKADAAKIRAQQQRQKGAASISAGRISAGNTALSSVPSLLTGIKNLAG